MDSFIHAVTAINSKINGLVWGIPMLVLILATGIQMTVRTGFFQIFRAKAISNETFFAIFKKKSVTKSKDKKAISQFQALSTALAATIGTGNIAGVATAITIGGPGAVFWMWVSAFFGMMTNFSENVLGIFYRKKNDRDEWSGGAMYYLQYGLGSKSGMKNIAKVLAVLFSVFCILASFGIGNMTQVNSIADAMHTNFGIAAIVTGVVLAVIAALVVVGGIKRIGQVTEKLVPFMALAYIAGALIIFFANYEQIPYVFGSIFKGAFHMTAIGGGVGGYVIKRAVTMGFKRGVFSNEAGLGSSVMVHSASDVKEPVIQGMWGIFEVFFDTIIVCTLTAFVLLSSSSSAEPQSRVFANLTTSDQTFSIAGHIEEGEEVPLIDEQYNLLAIDVDHNGNAKLFTEKPQEGEFIELSAYGKVYYAKAVDVKNTTEEDYIYTNIMSIRANAAKDSSGSALKDNGGNLIVDSVTVSQINGVSLVSYAFSRRFGAAAGKLLSVAILLFAFSTVLGWSFYGTKAVEYLFGNRATVIYKIIFVSFIVVGATANLSLAWSIADTLNGLMAIPNLIAVLALSGTVIKITGNYTKRKLYKNPERLKPMLSAYEDIQKEQEMKMEQEV
ncbi:MAG: alanine:cation symporter family protein [Lachnospiraceae bacterium]|nr:alanine:cation symporter family protein [Lachnospiraceae bacterium]